MPTMDLERSINISLPLLTKRAVTMELLSSKYELSLLDVHIFDVLRIEYNILITLC